MLNKKIAVYVVYTALFCYLFFVQIYQSWPFTIDDAYISLRYAKHLAAGHGFAWNIGSELVEGYSNYSYVLLEALFIKLHLPPITSIKLFSVIAMAGSCLGVFLLSRIWLPRIYAVLPVLILIMHPGEILWGVSGLETPFYQLLIVFTVYCSLKKKPISAGLLIALASLTRPEGPMLFLLFLGLELGLYIKHSSTSQRNAIIKFVSSFCLLFGPYFLWHLNYFGRLFPNSVYCKALNAPSNPFGLDITYLTLMLPMLIACIPYLKQKRCYQHFYLILPSIVYLIALINADWIVGSFDRHFLAVYALFLPFFVCGIHYLMQTPFLNLPQNWQHNCLIIYTLIGGYVFSQIPHEVNSLATMAQTVRSGNTLRAELSHWITNHIPKHYRIAVGDCGVIPYLHDGVIIDSYCLNHAGFTKPPINYSYKRFANWLVRMEKPEYIILISLLRNDDRIYPPSDFLISKNPNFYKQYRLVREVYAIQHIASPELNAYEYQIFQRNDIELKRT